MLHLAVLGTEHRQALNRAIPTLTSLSFGSGGDQCVCVGGMCGGCGMCVWVYNAVHMQRQEEDVECPLPPAHLIPSKQSL